MWISFGQYWTDHGLVWNPEDFGNISTVHVRANEIWRPDVILYNEVSDKIVEYEDHTLAELHSSGAIWWIYPGVFCSTCEVDVTYFPWDQQECELIFGAFMLNGNKMELYNASFEADLNSYVKSSEWTLLAMPATHKATYYECCVEPYYSVTYYIKIRRKPFYYVINLIMPTLLITATACFAFYLPAESGEKVSLGVTVLLAMCLFMSMISESLPASDTIPIIAQYFGATTILMSLSTMMSVVSVNIHHRGAFGQEVPAWMRCVLLNWMARLVCLKNTVDGNIEKRTQNHKVKLVRVISAYENGIEANTGNHTEAPSSDPPQRVEEPQNDAGCRNDWMLAARVLDRFLLFLFVVLIVTVSAVILTNHPR